MNIEKKCMNIGLLIEGCGILCCFIFIFLEKHVPGFVPVLVWGGMCITLISSLLLRKKMRKENVDSERSVIDVKIVLLFSVLVILTIILTLVNTV